MISLGAAVDHAWVAASVLCWGMGGGIWFMARGYGSAMASALTAVQNCSGQSLRTTEGLSYGNLQEGKEKLLYLNSERQVKQEP